MPRALPWHPVDDIAAGCADISFAWQSAQGSMLEVLMHFSRVIDGHEMDLRLAFDSPCALQWEEESFGLIPIPSELPRCASGKFARWTFPTLLVEGSHWAETYAARRFATDDPAAKELRHYVMLSLNDTVHVLAFKAPRAQWLSPVSGRGDR